MVVISVGIFFGIFFALIIFNIIVLMAFRRKGVSVLDGLFKFYFKHGFLWFYRKPELYFKDRYAKPVRLTGIVGLVTFLIILSVVLTSCAKTDYTNVLVTRVFDGDTLRLANGEKVRLLGIDTPEMYESDKLFRDAQRTGEDIEIIMAKGRKSYKFTREFLRTHKVPTKENVRSLFLSIAEKLGHKRFVKKDRVWKESYNVTVNHYIQPELVEKIEAAIVK